MPNPVIVRRVPGLATSAGALSTNTLDWLMRVQNNGGARPSASTIAAVDAWYKGIQADGLQSLMISVCGYVPDNSIAARTPFYKTAGNDPWIENNGPAPGFNVNGFSNNGAQNYLHRTGVIPNAAYPSSTNAGFSLYAFSVPQASTLQFGAYDGTRLIGCRLNYPGLGSQGAISNSNANYAGSAAFAGNGYYSFNRISGTDFRAFFANSTNAHAQIGSTQAANDAISIGIELYSLLVNQSNSPGFGGACTLSFVAIHAALTAAQSSSFFNRIQTFRKALGGGFI